MPVTDFESRSETGHCRALAAENGLAGQRGDLLPGTHLVDDRLDSAFAQVPDELFAHARPLRAASSVVQQDSHAGIREAGRRRSVSRFV
jgi:hypothetical protein